MRAQDPSPTLIALISPSETYGCTLMVACCWVGKMSNWVSSVGLMKTASTNTRIGRTRKNKTLWRIFSTPVVINQSDEAFVANLVQEAADHFQRVD